MLVSSFCASCLSDTTRRMSAPELVLRSSVAAAAASDGVLDGPATMSVLSPLKAEKKYPPDRQRTHVLVIENYCSERAYIFLGSGFTSGGTERTRPASGLISYYEIALLYRQ